VLPAYLLARGCTPAQVGVVTAVLATMRIATPYAWGALGDRSSRRMQLIQRALLAAIVALGAIARGRPVARKRRLALIPAAAATLFVVTTAVAQLVQIGSARPALSCDEADPGDWRGAEGERGQLLAKALADCDALVGLRAAEVRRQLGAPARAIRLRSAAGKRRAQWNYRVRNPGDGPRELVLLFEAGRVWQAQ